MRFQNIGKERVKSLLGKIVFWGRKSVRENALKGFKNGLMTIDRKEKGAKVFGAEINKDAGTETLKRKESNHEIKILMMKMLSEQREIY